ncbi:MAG: PDZ domain-containing protein [Phycisphaerales bacterium]|nr:PDZ domain-containing protein [Phycisphaerales bacterium]
MRMRIDRQWNFGAVLALLSAGGVASASGANAAAAAMEEVRCAPSQMKCGTTAGTATNCVITCKPGGSAQLAGGDGRNVCVWVCDDKGGAPCKMECGQLSLQQGNQRILVCSPSGAGAVQCGVTCTTGDGKTCQSLSCGQLTIQGAAPGQVMICSPTDSAGQCQVTCTTGDGKPCRTLSSGQLMIQGRAPGRVMICPPTTSAKSSTCCCGSGAAKCATGATCATGAACTSGAKSTTGAGCASGATCNTSVNCGVAVECKPATMSAAVGGASGMMTLTPTTSFSAANGATLALTPSMFTTISEDVVQAPRAAAVAVAGANSGAWLGVQLGEVSDILSAQLDLAAGQGVTVLNIVKDSPAEKAGLLRFDIITAVNGQPASGGVPAVAELIGALKAGDRVTLDVMRQGKALKLDATLAQRSGDFQWKFDFAPGMTAEDSVNLRGRIIRPDENGAWIVEDIDDLDAADVEGLPGVIQKLMPHGQSTIQKFYVDGDRQSIRIERTINGETIVVEQGEDGQIDVVRKDAQGNEKKASYANREELRKNDEEAASLIEGHGGGAFFGGQGADPHSWLRHGGAGDPKYLEELKAKLREAEEAFQGAMKDIESEWKQNFDDGDFKQWREHLGKLDSFFKDGQPGLSGLSKARQSYHVAPDGSIEVHIRKGDSEMIRTFRSEQDLQKSDPRLYEKYQQMMKDE